VNGVDLSKLTIGFEQSRLRTTRVVFSKIVPTMTEKRWIAGLTLPIERREMINPDIAAPRTVDPVGPTMACQIRLAGVVVRERRFELQRCHLLKAGHLPPCLP